MSISETVSYDKDGRIERPASIGVNFPLFKKLFLSLTIILFALLSFGIGRLSVAGNREPVRIEYDVSMSNDKLLMTNQAPISNSQTATVIRATEKTEVIASKNGARYHYPYCSGAKQIKEENKIVFPTPAAAEAAGYTLAANCKPR